MELNPSDSASKGFRDFSEALSVFLLYRTRNINTGLWTCQLL